jgi:hypothetical protein
MPDDKVQAYMMGVASTVVDAKKEVIEALELIARHVGGVADARPVPRGRGGGSPPSPPGRAW